MAIGILGAGGIGQALASQVAKAGYDVILSNSRGPESLAGVASQMGPRASQLFLSLLAHCGLDIVSGY